MDALRNQSSSSGSPSRPKRSSSRRQSLFVLTDGRPNINEKGTLNKVRQYKCKHPDFLLQMNTVGFGYELDSELLWQLAVEGSGTFAFIPTANVIGTVFVNTLANALSMHSLSATLKVTSLGGAFFLGSVQGACTEIAPERRQNHREVQLGPLLCGQSKDIVIPMRVPAGSSPYLDVDLNLQDRDGCGPKVRGVSRKASPDALVAVKRCEAVNLAYELIKKRSLGVAARKLQSLAEHLSGDIRLDALKIDIVGRMLKALSDQERFERWGKHYLLALTRSHQVQQCTNWLDAGLQIYGGQLFRSLRHKGDTTFLKLPPPVPVKDLVVIPCDLCRQEVPAHEYQAHASRCSRLSSAPVAALAPARPPVVRAPSYSFGCSYGGGGGCFGPTSSVIVVDPDGEQIKKVLTQVRAGDSVLVSDGIAHVRCVIRIDRPGKELIYFRNGLSITHHHPVCINGEWRLPLGLGTSHANPSGLVYNFILDRSHVLLVDRVACATWGHGIEGDVVGHPYFGTDWVVNDVTAMAGWEEGFVSVKGCIRDREMQVVGLWQ